MHELLDGGRTGPDPGAEGAADAARGEDAVGAGADADAATAPLVVDAGDDRSRRARTLLAWTTFVAGSWLFLRPILVTTIVADDFVNPFNQFTQSGVSPVQLLQDGWNSARNAGHINFVGQIIGGVLNTTSNVLMAEAGVRYSTIYAGYKLIALLLAALAGAAFARRAAEAMGRPVGAWHARLGVAVLLFASLQLHIPWSNDPVGSYPASGYASAAFGFLVLSSALDALTSDRLRRAAVAGALGAIAVWYYEINIAAVVAVVPLLVWWWTARRSSHQRPLQRLAAHASLLVVAPGVAVLASKVLMAPADGQYTGTQVAVGSGVVDSVAQGLASTMPGAAWPLSRDWLGVPVAIWATPVLVMTVVTVVLVALARHRPLPVPGRVSYLAGGIFAVSALGYMLGATVVQSATQKVQDETPRIGYVYNYYAIGSTALAVVVFLIVLSIPARWNRPTVRIVASGLFIVFAAVQLLVNWNITVKFNAATAPNRHLLVTYSERRDVEERCEALWNWSAGGWPEYYEIYMIEGLEASYQYFHGESFCPGFVRPP